MSVPPPNVPMVVPNMVGEEVDGPTLETGAVVRLFAKSHPKIKCRNVLYGPEVCWAISLY